jgi:hypothetical protein
MDHFHGSQNHAGSRPSISRTRRHSSYESTGTASTNNPDTASEHANSKTALISTSITTPGEKDPLGKQIAKHRTDRWDLLKLSISVLCCVLGVSTVASNRFAWTLRSTSQLIIVGFVLSIMSLCNGKVAITLYLQLETRFGRSKLQNYNAILTNDCLKARLNIIWRLVLLCTTGFPIILSVAYKQFLGGTSTIHVNATEISNMPAYYGLFSVPGINTVRGNNMGLSPYFNSTPVTGKLPVRPSQRKAQLQSRPFPSNSLKHTAPIRSCSTSYQQPCSTCRAISASHCSRNG